LIFCDTRIRAGRLAMELRSAGFGATSLHGDLSQKQRNIAMGSFRRGDTPILVATDVAARGLDIFGVSHVLNYDLPHEALVYFHRIGRTARAGKPGTDRKSTRLNSSHGSISYAVFCLKKKKEKY